MNFNQEEMKEHWLKTIQPHFDAVKNEQKTFELRKDDRPFAVGDFLVLEEYDPESKTYSGQEVTVEILHILRNAPEFGLKPGYCILSIARTV